MAMTHFADERKRAIKDAEKTYNQKVKDLKSDYDTQIFETGRGYEDAYRENAVQKAINERQVAESMANMGLRDSGLNRTQQTAVQLGYANNNAAIDKSKRQAVDSLNLQKTRGLASLKQDWLTQKEGINQTYDNMEKEYKTESTKAYYQHLTDVAKLNKQQTIWYWTGVKDESGNPIFRNSDGKTQAFGKGVNPYNSYETHKDLFNEKGEYDSSKAFENGYQPNNIGGVRLQSVVYRYGKNAGWEATYDTNGNGINHKVLTTDGKHFYVWDDYAGIYRELPNENYKLAH